MHESGFKSIWFEALFSVMDLFILNLKIKKKVNLCLQTERKFISDPEKVEMDM